MKETYNNKKITFNIKIVDGYRTYTVPFDGVLGLEADDFCQKFTNSNNNKFILETIISIALSEDETKKEITSIEMPAIFLPFELIIKGYSTNKSNWDKFNENQKNVSYVF